jgi:uncharacterized membrane protein YgcG
MLFVCGVFVSTKEVQAETFERIESFSADIVVAPDSSFNVTEVVTYTFNEERHGIYRTIPIIHAEKPTSFFKERYIDVNVEGVHMDGALVPYSVSERHDEVKITIGDSASTVSGTHTYEIMYSVAGAVSYSAYGGAELYWDVTGFDWDVPMYAVEAHVSAPSGILLRERACYRGLPGEAASCDMSIDESGNPHFSGRLIGIGEGLTIAQALNRSQIPVDIRERYNILWVWGLVVFGVVLIGGFALYRYKTKFKTDVPIIPQYEPYPEVKPMYAGYLFDRRLDPRDITAGIVYLAEQGFLRIRKTESKVLFFFEVDDYEITLLRSVDNVRDIFEQYLLELMFSANAPVGSKVTLRDLKNSYTVANKNRKLLAKITEGLRVDMKERGFYVGFSFASLFGKIWIGILVGLCIIAAAISQTVFVVCAVIALMTFVLLIDGRRTKKGYEALDHLKGFKDFLRVTDSQRFIFHNAPERNAEHFMEYLPFAIAFGVEKEWAKTFEGITIPNPNWYDGGSGAGAFNAIALTQSLGGFSTAFATSSGASASGGGGHAGGGSGGGGGGSW